MVFFIMAPNAFEEAPEDGEVEDMPVDGEIEAPADGEVPAEDGEAAEGDATDEAPAESTEAPANN
jgi:hypothetical protein